MNLPDACRTGLKQLPAWLCFADRRDSKTSHSAEVRSCLRLPMCLTCLERSQAGCKLELEYVNA